MECGGEAGEPVAVVEDAAPAGGVGADVAAGLLDEFGPGLGQHVDGVALPGAIQDGFGRVGEFEDDVAGPEVRSDAATAGAEREDLPEAADIEGAGVAGWGGGVLDEAAIGFEAGGGGFVNGEDLEGEPVGFEAGIAEVEVFAEGA